jgi:hypothetical protein
VLETLLKVISVKLTLLIVDGLGPFMV